MEFVSVGSSSVTDEQTVLMDPMKNASIIHAPTSGVLRSHSDVVEADAVLVERPSVMASDSAHMARMSWVATA